MSCGIDDHHDYDDIEFWEEEKEFAENRRVTNAFLEFVESWSNNTCVDCGITITTEEIMKMLNYPWLLHRNHESFQSIPRCFSCYEKFWIMSGV